MTPKSKITSRSPEPDLRLARRVAELAKDIETKLLTLELHGLGDPSIGAISAGLLDLWGSKKNLKKSLEGFLETPPGELESLCQHLVDLQTELEHTKWTLQDLRKPLDDVISCLSRRIDQSEVSTP